MQTFLKAVIAVGALTFGCFAQAYTLESSVTQVPLIELYTSEGCNSCPPADKWLAQLAKSNLTAIPLAFHVDYWDNLGWKDVFATPQAQGTARQHALASQNHASFVYTPEIFTDFEENKFWHDKNKFIAYVQESNKKIAPAKIVVKGVLEKKSLI
jgi:hypothetical protein